jgi:hypothetical protein
MIFEILELANSPLHHVNEEARASYLRTPTPPKRDVRSIKYADKATTQHLSATSRAHLSFWRKKNKNLCPIISKGFAEN